MADRTERSALNHILEACRDGELGLREAADQVISPLLRKMLLDLASQRERFATELLPFAQRLGGEETGDGTLMGAMHRRWMTLRGRLTHDHDNAFVSEAARAEQTTIEAYEEALHGMLPPTALETIERQYAQVREANERIRTIALN